MKKKKNKKQNRINPILISLMLIGLVILVLAGTFTITLNAPTDNTATNGLNVLFNCTAESTTALNNISLYHNNSATFHRNETIALSGTFTNGTGAFSIATIGGSAFGGLATNGTDFFSVDDPDNWMYHFSSDGTNITDGNSTAALPSVAPFKLAFNLTVGQTNFNSFWIYDSGNNGIFPMVNGVNVSGGFDALDETGNGVTGFDANTTDLYMTDNGVKWVSHVKNGVNQSDGFDVSFIGNPQGLAILNGIIWVAGNNGSIFPFDPEGTLQSGSFNGAAFGIGNLRGLASDGTDLFALDDTDKVIYELKSPFTTEQIFTKNITNSVIWNCESCDEDGVCDFAANNFTLIVVFTENNNTFNSTTRQTKAETFELNITSFTTPTAKLYLNNSNQGTATITTLAGNNYIISKTVDINISWEGAIDYYYEITNTAGTANSTINSVTINPTQFEYCNATLAQRFLNITFKDEDTDEFIQAQIPTSTFFFWIGSGTQKNSFSYSNTTEGEHFWLCSNALNDTINVNPFIQYKNLTNYPQRTFNTTSISTDNSTTDLILFLLKTTDGQNVAFQVINSAEQVVSGVIINATRNIAGSQTLVAEGITGSDGTVTFFLNPDFSHILTFRKTGFVQTQFTVTPTQTSYTVTLVSAVAPTGVDYTKGVTYSIRPPADFELLNQTSYNFNFTLSSSFWTVDEFGFLLRTQNGTILGQTSLVDNGGFVNLDQNTINNSRIIMDYFWVINSTYINQTTYWNVLNTDNTQFSIRHFFTDLNAYLNTEMFGIDSFGRYLIIFLILFTSVGIMSFKFGLASPMSITSAIFAVIFFFDVVVGLLPTPINAIPHSLTFLAAIILITTTLKEVLR